MDHAAAGPREGTGMGTIAPFLTKTYEMVDDPKTDSVVSWSAGNNSFVVWNVPEFQKEFLPKYFKHNNFSSFIRQLNTYGFKKVDPDRYEFANEWFLRGQKHLLKNINRKRTVQTQSTQPSQVQNSSAAACVEIGKFGIEEEIDRLKRDKNVLMQELVRLRQQQQATDNQLQNVGQRVQVMEQRQQQMMSFLAKAMQSPGFLNQLVQQQNESNRLITGSSKKRRLPGQEEEVFMGGDRPKSPNGQIVKFRSSMNEAAKAMLFQIMKMNSAPRREPSMNHSSPLLIDNLPSSCTMEGDNSAAGFSGVILSEVPPSSGPASVPLESGHPTSHSSTVFAEVHTNPSLMTDHMITDNAELNVNNFGQDDILANLTEMQEIMPDSSVDVNFEGSGNGDYTDPMSSLLDATVALETDIFPPNQDVDGIHKLPGINDVFWEQFLTASSPTGDTEDTTSSSPENGMAKEQGSQSWQENGWDKIQNMNHLTERMELLTSASRRG